MLHKSQTSDLPKSLQAKVLSLASELPRHQFCNVSRAFTTPFVMISLPSAFSCKVKVSRTTSDSFLYFFTVLTFCKQWLGFPPSLELIVSPQGQLEFGHGGENATSQSFHLTREPVVTHFPTHHCSPAFHEVAQCRRSPQHLKICTNEKMSIDPLFHMSLLKSGGAASCSPSSHSFRD